MAHLTPGAVRGAGIAVLAVTIAGALVLRRCAERGPGGGRRSDAARPGRPSEIHLVRAPDRPAARLAPAGRLAGVVVDERGAAVAGAAVEIHPIGAMELVGRTESDDDGGFALEVAGMAGARVGVAARAGSRTDHRWVTLRAQATDRVVLRLDDCHAATVRLRAADGSPVRGAVVREVGYGGLPIGEVIADERGTATVCPREGQWLEAAAAGFATATIRDVSFTQVTDVTLLPGAVDLAGTVLGPDWRPVAGARVKVFDGHQHRNSLRSPGVATTLSGVDGSFRFPGLAASTYTVEASGRGLGHGGSGPIELRAGRPSPPALVILAPCRRISGRVERDGRPLVGVRVQSGHGLAADAAVTDAAGELELECVGFEEVTIVVPKLGVEPLTVEAGDADVAGLVLAARHDVGVLRGVVTRAGAPVGGAKVAVAGLDDHDAATSGLGGGFEIGGLPLGVALKVSAEDPSTGERGSGTATLAAELASPLAIALAPVTFVELRARVTDPSGRPASQIQVWFTRPDGRGGARESETDADGWLVERRATPGTFAVSAGPLARRTPLGPVTIPPGAAVTTAAFVLPVALHDLAGRVVGADGRPALAELRIDERGIGRGIATDAAGRFRFPGVLPGRHTLEVRGIDGARAEVAVASPADAPVIQLAAIGAIDGSIETDADCDRIEIELSGPGPTHLTDYDFWDRTFHFAELIAGSYSLAGRCIADDETIARGAATVAVTAGATAEVSIAID